MYKKILFPIIGMSSVKTGMQCAIEIARLNDGHVEAICCRRVFEEPLPMASEDWDPVELENLLKSFEKEEKARVSAARKAFDEVVNAAGVPYIQHPTAGDGLSVSWEVVRGRPADEIVARAGASDLVVAGRKEEGVGPLTRSIAEVSLFVSGRPVFIAPQEPPGTIGKNIVVGWNRSAAAGRSVHAALPMLKTAETVRIVSVATNAKDGPAASAMQEYLALHGVTAALTEVDPDYRPVSEILLDESKDAGADLLIMGAFSHSRLRELVLGGVTRDIFQKADIPVLMAN